MIVIFYSESDLKMEDAMKQTREGQKIQNAERQEAYQGRKSNEMTTKEREEDLKTKKQNKKKYRKRKLGEMTSEE